MKKVIQLYGLYRKTRRAGREFQRQLLRRLGKRVWHSIRHSRLRQLGLFVSLVIVAIVCKDQLWEILGDGDRHYLFARKALRVIAKKLSASGRVKHLGVIKKMSGKLKKFHGWFKKIQLNFNELMDA
ncbi:hypothetical protein CEQ90_15075 [Lewinellaceae bacterium SD302]|nr:hypothetical protein CEQ90_15075 [Lewinellaceae bacterium SD302]